MTQNRYRKFIVQLHDKEGISYKVIARKLGISACYLSRWISGEKEFSSKVISNILAQYGAVIMEDKYND